MENHKILKRPIEIFLVEDNIADIRLIEEAFLDGTLTTNINYVMDGEEAIKYLKRSGIYQDSVIPDIIFLDLNLPKKNGLDVLKEIKTDDAIKEIPVIVLTTSKADKDIKAAYSSLANAYIPKPIDFNVFLDVIKTVETFWLTFNRLP